MYIKLTKLNGSPIWLNASFIVTVEPRAGGGSIVVPIGDGLDYDVKEKPEVVLGLLEGAPVPEVIPVPTSDALTMTPDDVSPADVGEVAPPAPPLPSSVDEAEKPAAKKTTRAKSPAKKTTRKSTRAKKSEAEPSTGEQPAADELPIVSPTSDIPLPEVPLAISDEQIERLKKMAPGSIRKLANTLEKQFKVTDAEAAVHQLQTSGVIVIEKEHIVWK